MTTLKEILILNKTEENSSKSAIELLEKSLEGTDLEYSINSSTVNCKENQVEFPFIVSGYRAFSILFSIEDCDPVDYMRTTVRSDYLRDGMGEFSKDWVIENEVSFKHKIDGDSFTVDELANEALDELKSQWKKVIEGAGIDEIEARRFVDEEFNIDDIEEQMSL